MDSSKIPSSVTMYTNRKAREHIEKASDYLGVEISDFVLQAAQAETEETLRIARLSRLWKRRFGRSQASEKTREQRDVDTIEKMQESIGYVDKVTLMLLQKAMEWKDSLKVAAARLHIPLSIAKKYVYPDGHLTELGTNIVGPSHE